MAEPKLWWRYNLTDLITDAIHSGPVTLHVEPRPDVASRRWYRLAWVGEDEQSHEVEGQSMEIVLRRAAEKEWAARQKYDQKQAEMKTPEEWLQEPGFADVAILDPDGWRNPLHGLMRTWHEPLPLDEFCERLVTCTVGPRKPGERGFNFIVSRVPVDKTKTTLW